MTRWLYRATTGLVLVALAQAPARAEDTGGRVVRYADDALTVRLTLAPVSEVLDEIGRQTGAEIQGQVAEVREVSADFDAVPLPEALHRLLGNQNFALVYGEKGNLKAVKLLGLASTTATTPVRPVPVSTTPAPPPEATVSSLLDAPVSLPAGSRLAQALGTTTPPLRQVVEVGLSSEDASVRAEAVRVALKAAEAEPRFRTAVAETVGGMDDISLSMLLRETAGEHAEEIARLVASQTTIAPVRIKANTFLRMLPDQ